MSQLQNEAPRIPEIYLPWEKIYAAKLELLYPGFADWLAYAVAPGLRTGGRRLFVHDEAGQFGLVIAKRSANEHKLCTVYTDQRSRGKGVASRLMSKAIDWLGNEKPLITISEDRLVEFEPLINKFDFSLTQVVHSYYRLNTREFVFNGRLPSIPNFTLKSREQIPLDRWQRAPCRSTPAIPPGPSQNCAQIFDEHQQHL
jgi:GNAT superfamily N-acetyltransferase